MRLEFFAALSPLIPLKLARAIQTIHRAISHVQRVVRVIVREESLAAERDQVLKTLHPIVEQREVVFKTAFVYGIRVGQTAREYLKGLPRSGIPAALSDSRTNSPSSASVLAQVPERGSQGSSAQSTVRLRGSDVAL